MHKTLLRIWLVLWVITLPLVHIHPEADHANAGSGHVHGGSYHSILVNTPVHAHHEHNQEAHSHDGFFSPGDAFGPSHSSSQLPYDFEEATYGFSVIKPSIVLESEKSHVSHDVVVAGHIETFRKTGGLTLIVRPKKSLHSIPSATLSARAPPVLSI